VGLVFVAETDVVFDLLRFRGRDTLPIGLSDTLRLAFDNERGEWVAPLGTHADHLFTVILVGALNHLHASVEARVLVELNKVALGHHHGVHGVVAKACIHHVLHIVECAIDTTIRVPIEASRGARAVIILKDCDSSDFTSVIGPKNGWTHVIVMIADSIVVDVTSTAVTSAIASAVWADTIVAEVVPDILTTDVGAGPVVPIDWAHGDLGALAVMANPTPSFLQAVMLFAVSTVLKLILVVEEATIIARVVNQRLEATNVDVKQSRHDWLSHCFNKILL
jgi:hypothetical protein